MGAANQQLNRDYDDGFAAIIEEGYPDKSFQNIGPSQMVAFGINGTMGWTNRWFKAGRPILTAEEIGVIYARMAIAGLSPEVSLPRPPRTAR